MQRRFGGAPRGESVVQSNYDPPVRYSPGRVCGEPDCDTVLSQYNSTGYCSLHDDTVVVPWLGRMC